MFGVVCLVTISTLPLLWDWLSWLFPLGLGLHHIAAQLLGAYGQALGRCDSSPLTIWEPKILIIFWVPSLPSLIESWNAWFIKQHCSMVFINEFVGSFVLFFAAMGLTKNFFRQGDERQSWSNYQFSSCQMAAQGTSVPKEQIAAAISPELKIKLPFKLVALPSRSLSPVSW